MPKKRQTTAEPHENRLATYLRPACVAFATALAVAAPLVPSERTEMTGAALPQAMLWLLLALLWFGGAWLWRRLIPRFTSVEFVAFAFAGWIALSGVVMMRYGAPRPTINAVWTWISMIAAFVLLRQLLWTTREVRALYSVMIGVAVCLSIIAIHQAFIAHPAMRALYERDPEEALRQANISAPPGTVQRQLFESRLYSTEPMATFSLTNSLAGFIAPWLVVLVAVASRRQLSSLAKQRGFLALTTWVIASPIATCLLLTKSRTAWLATMIGIMFVAYFRMVDGRRPAMRRLLATIVGIAVVLFISASIAAVGIFSLDILAPAWRSLAFRLEYWRATAAMIIDYPLFGIGVGNFQEYYTAYKPPQASETISDPHNFAFEIAASAGSPALLLFIALLFFAVISSRSTPDAPGKEDNEQYSSRKQRQAHSNGLHVKQAIYIGALIGVPLALALGLVTGFWPEFMSLLLGSAAGALAIWLLNVWVENGELPRWLSAVAMGVLLLNLLAAGGISFPGVAISLWILLATVDGGHRPAPAISNSIVDHPACDGVDRWFPGVGALISAVLLLAFFLTAYQPVLTRMRLSLAISDPQLTGNLSEAIALAKAASHADRWSAEPHEQLAQLYFERWYRQRDEADVAQPDFAAFIRHAKQAVEKNKRGFPSYAVFGYLQWEAAKRTGDRQTLDDAVRWVERSVELYPHDALGRVQLAWIFDQAQRPRDAQREAAEALRLDQLCPHSERKLAERRLFTEMTSADQQDRMTNDLQSLNAEQWAKRLRSK